MQNVETSSIDLLLNADSRLTTTVEQATRSKTPLRDNPPRTIPSSLLETWPRLLQSIAVSRIGNRFNPRRNYSNRSINHLGSSSSRLPITFPTRFIESFFERSPVLRLFASLLNDTREMIDRRER